MTPTIYAFYNNKGGVGKTTLCGNAAALYAEKNPTTQVYVHKLMFHSSYLEAGTLDIRKIKPFKQ